MLITDKKNRNYAFVTLEDIISSMETANYEDTLELKKLFKTNEQDQVKIKKQSRVYDILKNSEKVINGDEYITSTMLASAYTRASVEFNYEMKDRLFKYLKKYLDNMAENKTNEKLIQKILCDDKVMEYVQKFDSFEEYTKHLIGTRLKPRETKIETKSKSFVRIAV
jgi:hypothetical protein